MSGQDEPCAVISSQQLLERNKLIGRRVLNWIITNSNYSWTFIVPTLHILFQEFENFHILVKCLFSIKLLCGGLITFRIIVYEDDNIIVKVLLFTFPKCHQQQDQYLEHWIFHQPETHTHTKKLSLHSVCTTMHILQWFIIMSIILVSRYETLVKRSKNWWNVFANTADQPQWGGTSCILNILCG